MNALFLYLMQSDPRLTLVLDDRSRYQGACWCLCRLLFNHRIAEHRELLNLRRSVTFLRPEVRHYKRQAAHLLQMILDPEESAVGYSPSHALERRYGTDDVSPPCTDGTLGMSDKDFMAGEASYG